MPPEFVTETEGMLRKVSAREIKPRAFIASASITATEVPNSRKGVSMREETIVTVSSFAGCCSLEFADTSNGKCIATAIAVDKNVLFKVNPKVNSDN